MMVAGMDKDLLNVVNLRSTALKVVEKHTYVGADFGIHVRMDIEIITKFRKGSRI